MTEDARRHPDFARADRPSDEPQQAGIGQGGTAAIGRDDRLVDRFCATGEAGHPALGRQSVRPFDQDCKHAAVLDPDEDCDRRRENCDADREPPCCRGRVVGLTGGEQPHADEDKDELGRRADRNVDHHAGGGLRARNAPLMHEPRAYDVAADAGDGQQRADGFADPAHPEKAAGGRDGSRPETAPARRPRQNTRAGDDRA